MRIVWQTVRRITNEIPGVKRLKTLLVLRCGFHFCFSAGVGRSGAYIVIHSMMKRMIEMRDVNIFDFVAQIRQQRNLLVQEEVGEATITGWQFKKCSW